MHSLLELSNSGNFIVVASTASLVIGLSWGGIQNPWTSWETLVPLIVGLAGLVVFFIYEFNWAAHPVVPWDLVSNRTSLAGYTMWILHGILSVALICEWFYRHHGGWIVT